MNMIPVLIVAVLVALGLKFIPEKMINGFQIFAKFLVALITLGLAAAVVKFLLGWELIPGLDPIFMAPGDKPGEVMRAIEVIGSISCVLLGAYPMVLLLTDAPRDKCTLSCAINGIHAAFHYLKKNYISGCVMTVPTGW